MLTKEQEFEVFIKLDCAQNEQYLLRIILYFMLIMYIGSTTFTSLTPNLSRIRYAHGSIGQVKPNKKYYKTVKVV